MRAAKNPSSSSMFIALSPSQVIRKSPRRSSSASVSGSFRSKVFTGVSVKYGGEKFSYNTLDAAENVHRETRPVSILHLLLHEDSRLRPGGSRFAAILQSLSADRSSDDSHLGRSGTD